MHKKRSKALLSTKRLLLSLLPSKAKRALLILRHSLGNHSVPLCRVCLPPSEVAKSVHFLMS